jgi:hypothetical protein
MMKKGTGDSIQVQETSSMRLQNSNCETKKMKSESVRPLILHNYACKPVEESEEGIGRL